MLTGNASESLTPQEVWKNESIYGGVSAIHCKNSYFTYYNPLFVTRDTKRLTGMNRYKEMREWGGLLEGLAGTCQIVPELPPLPS